MNFYKKLFYWSFCLLFVVMISSCSFPGQEEVSSGFTISSWNVQNLFDSKDDGNEYKEYTSAGNWTDSLYRIRLADLNSVFGYSHLKDSSVVVLNEVENVQVVKDVLALSNFRKAGLSYFALACEDGGAINTAVLSRIPISDVKIHSMNGVRPVLEVRLQTVRPVVILAVHAKSRKEGFDETAPSRLELGRTLDVIASDILQEDPTSLVVIAGDMNEDWTDCNMMMDSDSVFSGITDSPLLVTRSRFNPWYCFWLDDSIDKDCSGSYLYAGSWSCFDNILLSDASALESAGVVCGGILRKPDGSPNTWVRNTASGVSDHFPVWVTLSNL